MRMSHALFTLPFSASFTSRLALAPAVRREGGARSQRAAAPAGRTLALEETRKTISPYPFLG